MKDDEGKIYDRLKSEFYDRETDHDLCLESLRMNLIVRSMLMKYLDDLIRIYGTISFENLVKKIIEDRIQIRRRWLKHRKQQKVK